MENTSNVKETKVITQQEIEHYFKDDISNLVSEKLKNYNFMYQEVNNDERDHIIRAIVNDLMSNNLVRAGEHRQEKWESGWDENLKMLSSTGNIKSIIPMYFGKYGVVRLGQRFIKTQSDDFEYKMLKLILDWLFYKYFRDAAHIYEFGCGTGHNLIHLREYNKKAVLWGLDWTKSSQEIIKNSAINLDDAKLYGYNFDYFNPDYKFKLDKDGILFTVASLEQIGNKFHKFVDFVLQNKPGLCIHVEPIAELLDENNLLDFLSIEYFKRRNYLDGFLTYLRELEKRGEAKILQAQRTYIGSLYIEGYSVIVWTPTK